MSPKDETCAVNIPAFLSKLWKIVNDSDIDPIVCWSPDGRSFVIQDQAQFWYNILPIYYKHNNMSSFVRQLNMYGFHKIHADGKDKEHDELKFYHPFFRKNQPSLMKNIKRKITTTHRTPVKTEIAETTTHTQEVGNLNHMTKVLVDVKQLQTRQESVDNQLASMKKENAALWRELALLRQKHMKQQQLVNKLIHFLVHIVNPSRGNMSGMRKRKFPLMINDVASSSKSQKTDADDGLVIHEVENEYILPGDNPEGEEDEEALIDSPENILMDSSDEFLDIPMTDEVVDSPDSICPDNILAEDPEVEATPNTPNTPNVVEEESQPPPLTPSTDLITETPSVDSQIFLNVTSEENDSKDKSDLTVATKSITLNSPDDFETHLEATQEELDSIKELLLDGYTLDSNTVLNLNSNIFTDMPLQLFMSDDNLNLPPPGDVPSTSTNTKSSEDLDFSCDPMMSGSTNQLMPYSANNSMTATSTSNNMMNSSTMLDFENLFENETSPDNTMDPSMELLDLVNMADQSNQSTLNTPVQIKTEPPTFPQPSSSSDSTNVNVSSSSSSSGSSSSKKRTK